MSTVAGFLNSLPGGGLPGEIVQKFAQTKGVYIVGTNLHVHTLHLRKKDEANSILLATHFGTVKEVCIHNFHLYHYLIKERVHVRIAQSHWEAVRSVLSCIQRRPGVELGEGRRDPIRVTFDEFLRPAIYAWKEGEPYAKIVCKLPPSDTQSIVSRISIAAEHPSLSFFTRGYYESDSETEIEIENDDYEEREEFEILLFLAYPSVSIYEI